MKKAAPKLTWKLAANEQNREEYRSEVKHCLSKWKFLKRKKRRDIWYNLY